MADQRSGSPASFGTYGPDIEYKLSRAFRRPVLGRFVLTVVLTAICAIDWKLLGFIGWAAGSLAVIFGVIYLWQGRFGTRVTGRGIEIRGYFNHFLPWRDVSDIEVAGYGPANMPLDANYRTMRYVRGNFRTGAMVVRGRGSSDRMARLATIKVVRTNGSKLTLRAPRVTGWPPTPISTTRRSSCSNWSCSTARCRRRLASAWDGRGRGHPAHRGRAGAAVTP